MRELELTLLVFRVNYIYFYFVTNLEVLVVTELSSRYYSVALEAYAYDNLALVDAFYDALNNLTCLDGVERVVIKSGKFFF